MSGGLLKVLLPRMRRAALVLLPAAVFVAAAAYLALYAGWLAMNQAAGMLALSFVLFICGAILFFVSWLAASWR